MTASPSPYLLAGAVIIGLAVYALVVRPGALRRIIALNVMGSGVFLVLIASAARGDGAPDPVPHALVLTGIVVAVATSALAVTLARILHRTPSEADERDGAR